LGGKRKGKRGRDKGHRTIASETHFRRSEDLRAVVFPRKTESLVDETVKNAGGGPFVQAVDSFVDR
jgi:hypothetical protein